MTLDMGEGATPMIELPRLARELGLRQLWAKAEYVNPTGSYKDRIARTSMETALRKGFRGWIGTSSGNGGAAMSAYGARAGLKGILCVLEDVPKEKLASIAPYGPFILSMPALGPDVMRMLADIAQELKLYLTITTHAHNADGMVGARVIGHEIATHGGATHVYAPTGGGGLLVATARGLADSRCQARVVAAQPAGCAPISRFLEGEIAVPSVREWGTRISGLQLPEPPDGEAAVDAVRCSGGWGTAVEDEATWDAQRQLATVEGVFVEPASAVALAAVREDVRRGRLGADDAPCLVLTGSGLKDLSRFSQQEFAPIRVAPADLPQMAKEWIS